jgi:tetratricopeptide (TPR) repeat protein
MTRLHLTEEQLSILVDGQISETERAWMEGHLRTCESCFGAYQDTLRFLGIWSTDPSLLRAPEDAISRAKLIAHSEQPLQHPKRITLPRFSWRPAAVLSAAAVVIAAVAVWQFGPLSSADKYEQAYRPLVEAVENASVNGSIVIPGAEQVAAAAPMYRSGFVTADEAVENALSFLQRAYRDDSAPPEVAHWLISGFLATGELEKASVYVNDARMRYPDDSRFLILDGLVAYRSRDILRAEKLLQMALQVDPHNGAAMVNLGLVQYEQGQWDSARRTLESVVTEFAGSPLERRASTLIDGLLGG